MSLKTDLHLKLNAFAQKGKWNNTLVKIITAPLFWILLVSGVVRAIYYSVLLTTRAVDTATYINYPANILKGETDGLRTPVYPYFIKLVKLFGEQNLMDHVVVAQIIISFLAIILFYNVVKICFKQSGVVFSATLLYGVLLPVINFDKMVLTESLSISCSLLVIYVGVKYLQRPGSGKAWALTLFAFVCIMLRPSFVYLLPLIVVFWISRLLFFRKDWKMCLSGLTASVVVILLIMGYSHLNKKNHNFNGISVVSNNNEMAVIVIANIYQYGNDPEITAAIKANLDLQQKNTGKPSKGENVMLKFEPDRIHHFIMSCIKNQPVAFALAIGGKLIDLQTLNIFTNYADHKLCFLAFRMNNIEYMLFCVTFNILYIFIVVTLVMIITGWLKKKQIPWFGLLLWLLIFAQVAVAIIAGYSEYPRLILPAMPALIILLFSYIDKISFAIDRNKLKSYPVTI